MLTLLRTHLHRWLIAAGLALTVVFVVLAGLSYQNPLAIIGFIAIGLAAGGLVSAVGLLLEYVAIIAAAQKSVQASAQTTAQAALRQMQATEALRAAVERSADVAG